MTSGSDNDEERRVATYEAIQAAESVEAAVYVFRDAYQIGNASYHLAQTVVGEVKIDTPFIKTTYPPEWVGRYVMKGYVNIDPVIKEGLKRVLPFHWTEMEPDESAIELFVDYQSHNLDPRGYSVPVTDKVGRKALLSLTATSTVEDWDAFVKQHKQSWLELAHVIHKKAIAELFGDSDPAPILSPRELETLYWTALGKDYRDIATILDISENTIRTYMRSSRYKLDCSTMAQAVAKAINLRLINP